MAMKRLPFDHRLPAIGVDGTRLSCRLGCAALFAALVVGCGDASSDLSVLDAARADGVANDRSPDLLFGPDTAADQGVAADAPIGHDTGVDAGAIADSYLGDEPWLDTPAADAPWAIDADDMPSDAPAVDTSEAEAGGQSVPTCDCGPSKLCCPQGTACMRWVAVFDNECIPCGGPSQPCCANGPQAACSSPDLVCVDSYAPHSLSSFCRPVVTDGGAVDR
jgi:hypothetical protein